MVNAHRNEVLSIRIEKTDNISQHFVRELVDDARVNDKFTIGSHGFVYLFRLGTPFERCWAEETVDYLLVLLIITIT
jgi:hypothetical protein